MKKKNELEKLIEREEKRFNVFCNNDENYQWLDDSTQCLSKKEIVRFLRSSMKKAHELGHKEGMEFATKEIFTALKK